MLVIEILPDSSQPKNNDCFQLNLSLNGYDHEVPVGGYLRRTTAEALAGALGRIIEAEAKIQVNDALNLIHDHTRGYEKIPFHVLNLALAHAQKQQVKVRIYDPVVEKQRLEAEASAKRAEGEAKLVESWRNEARQQVRDFEVSMKAVFPRGVDFVLFIQRYVDTKKKQRADAAELASQLVAQ
jgi:hypothetical protein